MNIGELWATLGLDTKQFERSIKTTEQKIGDLSNKLRRVGKDFSLYVSLPLSAAGALAVKTASNFVETLNKVDAVFEDSSDKVKEWAKTSIQVMGLAKGTALDMAAAFGDMATGMGMSREAAADMSMSLVRLAADLASFKNIGIEETQTALTAIFTGETQSLKRLGVVMTEANLQAWAYSKGIQKNIQDMSQLEKVQLRYNYVMEMTKNAHGDFQRTSGSAANQLRQFRETLKELAGAFGSTILPVITPVIKKFSDFLRSLSQLDESTKRIIMVIGGIAIAIGPVLLGVANLIKAFQMLTVVFRSVSALFISNPFGMIAIAITGVVTAISLLASKGNETKKVVEEINKTAIRNISEQVAKTNELFRVAQDEKRSLQERKKAIEELNKISPEYFGNLTLETINTNKAKEAKEQYIQSLLKEAKVKAAQSKLSEIQAQILEVEIKAQQERIKIQQKTFEKEQKIREQFNKYLINAQGLTYQYFKTQEEDALRLVKTNTDIKLKKIDEEARKRKEKYEEQLRLIQQIIDSESVQEQNSQKIQATQLQTITERMGLLEQLQAKIEETEQKILKAQTQNEINRLVEIKKALEQEYEWRVSYADKIASLQNEINKNLTSQIEDNYESSNRAFEQSINEDLSNLKDYFRTVVEEANNLAANIQLEPVITLGQRLAETLYQMSDSLREGADSWMRFGDMALGIIFKVASALIYEILLNAIKGATQSANATGPFAVFVLPAMIALATGIVMTAIRSAMPKMAQGGIVPPGYPNDTYPALLSSGEVVVPPRKLREFGLGGQVEFRIEGTTLVGILNKMNKRLNSY